MLPNSTDHGDPHTVQVLPPSFAWNWYFSSCRYVTLASFDSCPFTSSSTMSRFYQGVSGEGWCRETTDRRVGIVTEVLSMKCHVMIASDDTEESQFSKRFATRKVKGWLTFYCDAAAPATTLSTRTTQDRHPSCPHIRKPSTHLQSS